MKSESGPVVEDAELERLMESLKHRIYDHADLPADAEVGYLDQAAERVADALTALRSYVSADTRRLDWLESGAYETGWLGRTHEEQARCWTFYGRKDSTIRNLIDSAMQESK